MTNDSGIRLELPYFLGARSDWRGCYIPFEPSQVGLFQICYKPGFTTRLKERFSPSTPRSLRGVNISSANLLQYVEHGVSTQLQQYKAIEEPNSVRLLSRCKKGCVNPRAMVADVNLNLEGEGRKQADLEATIRRIEEVSPNNNSSIDDAFKKVALRVCEEITRENKGKRPSHVYVVVGTWCVDLRAVVEAQVAGGFHASAAGVGGGAGAGHHTGDGYISKKSIALVRLLKYKTEALLEEQPGEAAVPSGNRCAFLASDDASISWTIGERVPLDDDDTVNSGFRTPPDASAIEEIHLNTDLDPSQDSSRDLSDEESSLSAESPMIRPIDNDTNRRMAAIEAKLRSDQGLAIVCLKNTNDPKKGSLRLEGDTDILVLKRFKTGRARESRTRSQNVAGAFFSRKVGEAIVLLSATPRVGSRFVRLDPWRFTIVDYDTSLTHEDIVMFLRSKGAFANGVLTNVIPIEAKRMPGESLSFDYSDPGIIGLTSRTPEILRLCENMCSVGEKSAVVAPVFTLFATMISNFEFVQGLKLDFIHAMVRWGKVGPHLVGEDRVGQQLLSLAEQFFFQQGWRRHFASKDFQGSLHRLLGEMENAVREQILVNILKINDKLDARRVTSPTAGGFQEMLPTLAQARADLDESGVTPPTAGGFQEMLRTLAQARENSDLDGVLDVASFVSPDNIPLSILGDKHSLDQLCDLKLLRKEKDEDNYSIDPRIQEAARLDRLPSKAFRALNDILVLCVKRNDPKREAAAEAALPHVKWLRESVHITGTLFQEDKKLFARLLTTAGHVYRKVLFDFTLCRFHYNDALTFYRAVYEQNHVTIAKALCDLGCADELLGDYHEAKKNYRGAISIYRDIDGGKAHYSAIASTLRSLGMVDESLGGYETAKEHYREALTMYRSLYGEDANHSEIARTLYHLGSVCKSLTDYAQAEKHLTEALAMYRAVPEDKNTAVVEVMRSLGRLYESQVQLMLGH